MKRRHWGLVLLAVVVVVVYVVQSEVARMHEPPSWWPRALLRHRSLAARGGVRLVYEVRQGLAERDGVAVTPEHLAATAEMIHRRADRIDVIANVRAAGGRVTVELPGVRRGDLERIERMLVRPGWLRFHIVDDGSEYMRAVAEHARASAARYPGVHAREEHWTAGGGAEHRDPYIVAPTYDSWLRFFIELPAPLAVPDGHAVLAEAMIDDTDEKRPQVVRSHYVRIPAELRNDDVDEVELSWDQEKNRPEITLKFSSKGGARFAHLTGENPGRKLAIVLDNVVSQAPVIEGRIEGGRARIGFGGAQSDASVLKDEAKEIVLVLRAGALPLPLGRVEKSVVQPGGAE